MAEQGPDPREKRRRFAQDYPERIEESEAVNRALLARPRVSLRLQLILGFLLVFLFSVAIATAIIISIYRVESRVSFLEIVNDYVLEIDKARRFEKNFFLYGTNLNDALEAVTQAKQLLAANKQEITRIIGPQQWQGVNKNIDDYEGLLLQLFEHERTNSGEEARRGRERLEIQVRSQGQKMILFAQDLMKKERRSMERALVDSRRIQMFSLVALLIFMLTTAILMSGTMVRSIERFQVYLQRIAAGDFTPITPARRYRDEFTDLGVAINRMMEDLAKHEAMLVQAHKMRAMGTLTAGVAHELNNPLNNITITSHMLLEDFKALSDEERLDMVSDVTKEAERAKKIVANLLDFTRESETKLEPLNLVELVKNTIGLASNQLKIAGVKTELHTMEDPPRILGDSQQLSQVFLNLILNAVAASSRGGKIELLVYPSDEPDHLSVKVVDYGTGIPRHILSRIFDPFFTTKEKGHGTGLGLSVSQGIVAKHGGQLLVSSQEGRGSTFTVILPVTTIS